jgi:BCD family chlorophyll transporter-like MFS transporter
MGLWGAAQAIAFGLGGFSGTVAVEIMRAAGASVPLAYGSVFLFEAVIFVAAASVAIRIAPARVVPAISGVDAGRHQLGLQAAR